MSCSHHQECRAWPPQRSSLRQSQHNILNPSGRQGFQELFDKKLPMLGLKRYAHPNYVQGAPPGSVDRCVFVTRVRARPTSDSLAWPLPFNKILGLFRSRWTMSWSCKKRRPHAMLTAMSPPLHYIVADDKSAVFSLARSHACELNSW